MSSRYSLRATPRKKELFDGMVETPGGRRSTRRKSQFPPIDGASDDGDSSSAAETTRSSRSRSLRRRGVGKFVENMDDSDAAPKEEDFSPVPEEKLAAVFKAKADVAPKQLEQNGHTNGKTNGKTNGHAKEAKEDVIDGWKPGMDPKVDYSGVFEFGGSFGTLALMIGFPTLMYYMWIGATYYDGKLPLPEEGQSLLEFGQHLGHLVYTGAFPHLQAWKIYWVYYVFEALCYLFMPGVYGYGKPLPHEGGKQLKYYCSAYASFYFTILVMGVLHFTGFFKIYTLLDEFGPLLSVAILSGFLCAFIAYFSAIIRGKHHRMTGYPIYDFFMGAELNPRMFGILDFKMFYEVRIPWFILFGLSCAAAARQYENYGYVSGEVMFLVMAHYLYANACAKGEQLIITTWDMYYEKWGFMLIFWNMAGVPLSYCHCTLYLANHDPSEYAWNKYALGLLYVLYICVYVIWDQANAQKNAFRADERGTYQKRYSFPVLPWTHIKNPKAIDTQTGDRLLCDGWYGFARKPHYACDAFFAVTWGLITGFNSPFPWFYPVFFCCMIAHRATRDIERCRNKYGEAWKEYERRVPYLFIPYVI
ncbi:ergosterol biosynthesis ERG4/ERG24 family-domain-containing protein [Hypoxylon trugodes]|uniref:ergosterol biosynthesis ERG4/ERG24 family-domain-containing protein n=1 Tax=Hypoxylon trugodes TaxID=326681 RepID=UPI0021963A37|nr:ergosterol biosynthesis ERG4/ERG24 family-domain-containing protein [Hypoxylon trugodes]KAI1390006.1 ergosterol biosynthesis ERG4/ERG24 family-domain-containing protein [Hypoxylon trugodes]